MGDVGGRLSEQVRGHQIAFNEMHSYLLTHSALDDVLEINVKLEIGSLMTVGEGRAMAICLLCNTMMYFVRP